MRTFQDLEKIGLADRAKFCVETVREFLNSNTYLNAVAGEAYYNKHNTTIEHYQKVLTTISGVTKPDIFGANYKLKTLFFRRLVTQQVQYVLGNGVTLSKTANKAKLGKDYDFQLQLAAKHAMAAGVCFGFWNVDHLEVFSYADTATTPGFCPLYDEKTGKLRAGVRFWFRVVDGKEIFRGTLYEEDGFTEYRCVDNEYIELQAKRGYIRTERKFPDGTIDTSFDANYGVLPIVPMYANDTKESELIGIRESIDAYDLIKSGFANNIDEGSEIYWLLTNTGGMDDQDLAQFLFRLKTVKAAAVDGDAGVNVDAKTVEIPTEARKTMLELLRRDIYEDFQALDVESLSAAQKTTQEIQAAYQSQDNKCADFEFYMLDFCQKVFELAGINDEPTFRWNRVVNQTEQTNMLLSAANYLTDEFIIKHLPFITPEEADDVIKNRDDEDIKQFNATDATETAETETNEEINENETETP